MRIRVMDERPEEGDAGVTRRQALAKGAALARQKYA